MSDDADIALAHLQASTLATGVGTVKVKDGEIFMFSVAALEGMLEVARKSPKQQVAVFVKHGPIASKETLV